MSIMNANRVKDKLLDIPWNTLNQSWNAKDLELTKVNHSVLLMKIN